MKNSTFLITLLFSTLLNAQNLDTTSSMQFTFSGSNQSLQAPNRFVQNSENSFIITTDGGDIRRLAVNGDTTSLNDTSFNQIRDLEKLSDGNFIAFGNSKGFPSQAKMIKFDSLGTIIWSHVYRYKNNGYTFGSAIEIDSGQLIVAGTNQNNFTLFKLDSLGDTLKVQDLNRRNSFGSPAEIIKRKNGNFILAGADDDYPFAIGFDSDLNTLWSYYEIIFISHSLVSIFEEDNNEIRLFAGKHNILLDSSGNKISDSTYSTFYHKVVKTDTGYLAVGSERNIAQATNLSSNGDSLSSFTYSDTSNFSSLYRDVIQLDSGCYAALGSISKKNNDRLGLLSYFGNCSTLTTSIKNIKVANGNVLIYPNPSNGEFNIKGIENNQGFEIYDLKGRLVKSGITEDRKVSSNLNSGIYFLRLVNKGKIISKRLLIQ